MGDEGPRGGATGRTLDAPVRRSVVAAERVPDADVSSLAGRLARLAARATGAPLTVLTLFDADAQIVLGSAGWHGPVPRDLPLCRTVVESGVPLIVSDARLDPRFCTNTAVVLDGVIAYLGLPVHEDGKVVGVLAVLDRQPRQWSPGELAAADDAAQLFAAGLGNQGKCDRADVADRARADRQDAFLDALLESLRTGVIACGTDGRPVLVNHALREMTGVEAGDAGLYRWAERIPLHHLDGRQLTPEELPLRRALGGETVRDESVMYLENGPRRVFSVNAQPIVDHAGTRLGAVATIADVTMTERMQRFRAVELTIARGLADGGSDLVAMGRTATRVVTDALGWIHGEMWLVDDDAQVLRRVGEYTVAGFRGPIVMSEQLARGSGLAGAAWQRGQSVRTRDIAGGSTAGPRLRAGLAVPVSSGAATLAVLTFFTDVANGADELPPSLLTGIAAQVGQFLERRRGELLTDALIRAKDDNFGLVGHELRTPLTSIVAYADIVLDTDGAVPFGEVRPMIETVARNAARLRRLVDALLDLSALDSGHAPLQPAAVDLAAVVTAAVTDAMPAAATAGIAVTANLPDRLPMTGDPMRLRQLMDILLENAVIYDPDGGLVSIRLTRRPASAYLEITDSGVGIPPPERDLVFDRFFRGAVTREHAIPGAGLGLAIARVIADLHHGTISLAPPALKAGTTIVVELPLQPPDGQPDRDQNSRS